MKLDIVDTVLSGFNRVASKGALGLIGAGILALLTVIIGFRIGGFLIGINAILGGLVMAATFIVYLVEIAAITVGSLRAFDKKDFSSDMFTENIFWPFLRMTGSNLVIQAFIVGAIYLIAYPLMIAGFVGMGSAMMGAGSAGALSQFLPALVAVGILAALVALYIFSALSLSLPRISVEDKRMFEALDESVQSTKGNRLRVIATMLPFIAFSVVAVAGLFQGGISGIAIYVVSIFLAILYFLSLLAELNTRLR